MLSLSDVTEAIEVLQGFSTDPDSDINALLQKTKDLFFLLMQEDVFYIVAVDKNCTQESLDRKDFLPYIAPVKNKNNVQYLRLFSHEDAAVKFLMDHDLPAGNCVAITAIESIQLAKYWFLRGVFGFILNDGSSWITISFSDYLNTVFNDLLGRPEMFNEEYVNLISFLAKINSGLVFYQATPKTQTEDDTLYIVSVQDHEDFQYTSIKFNDLDTLAKSKKKLIIVTDVTQFQSTTHNLQRALSEFVGKEW